MKFTVSKLSLLDALQHASTVVNGRATLPILSNVLLSADSADDSLSISATDLDSGIRLKLRANVAQAGAVTLPARRLLAIVNDLDDGTIEITAEDGQQVQLKSASVEFKLLALPADEFPPLSYEFPPLSVGTGGRRWTLPRFQLRALLRHVIHASCRDESRYILCGVYLQFAGEKLTATATDGRRLATISLVLPSASADDPAEVILPEKAVASLLRILGDVGDVTITLSKHAEFELVRPKSDEGKAEAEAVTANVLLVSKILEGVYPDFRKVIPLENSGRVAIDREAFQHAVHRVALVCTAAHSAVRFAFSKNSLVLSASRPDVGSAEESVALSYVGAAVTIALDSRMLLDCLRALACDEIGFEFTDALSACVVKTGDAFVYVQMPLRL